jgi:hypothetical protein
MYSNGFVIAVKNANGEILRESKNGEVFLPFYSNYSLRLKNTHNRSAIARIKIDGTDILGGYDIIVPAKGFVDVERFCLDGNLNKGNKLEFVPAKSDGRVQDPTSSENGKVSVVFKLEEEREIIVRKKTITKSMPSEYSAREISRFEYDSKGASSSLFSKKMSTCSCDSVSYNTQDYSLEEETTSGATVEGTSSSQLFKYGSIGKLEKISYEVVLWLKGAQKPATVKETKNIYCTICGQKNTYNSNYCMKCGNSLDVIVKMLIE